MVEEKSTRGRKKKAEKKTYKLQCLIEESLKEALLEQAEDMGLELKDYVRWVLLQRARNIEIQTKVVNLNEGNTYVCRKFDNKVQTTRTGSPREIRYQEEGSTEVIFGTGKLQNNKLKHEREFLLQQALIMASKLVDDRKFSTNIRVALPPTEFFNDEYVEKYKSRFPLGVHKFTIAGEPKEIEILDVNVLMEGYSAFVSILPNIKTTNNLLVFDLGGGTLDCIEVIYDRREKAFMPNRAESIRKGAIDLYECITNDINSNGNSVKLEWVESAIDDKEDMINSRHSIKANLGSAKVELKSMLNEIANKLECTLAEYDIVCVGGGTTIFKMLYDNPEHILDIGLDDTLFSNATGMLEQ